MAAGVLDRPWQSLKTCLVWACLGLVGGGGVYAQNPAQLGTTQLQELASDLLERSSYADAVPYLTELDRRLSESEDATAVRSREQVLFYLGLGRLQLADLHGAEAALSDFLLLFPDSPREAIARLYHADTFYYRREWGAALEAYQLIQSRELYPDLRPEQQPLYWEHYADVLYIERDWDAALPVFTAFRDTAPNLLDPALADEKLAKANSYLLQAAMEQGDFATALDTLPALSNRTGKVRYDIALNLSLLRGGDQLYEAQRYGQALHFYELVLRPDELRDYWQAQFETLTQERSRIEGVSWLADRRLQVDAELAQARQRLGLLGAAPPVTPSVGPATETPVKKAPQQVPDYAPALSFRIARCYMARQRVHEAYWAFQHLEEVSLASPNPQVTEFAEEALYGQVKMAAAVPHDDLARRLARRYLRTEPYLRFIGDVAYELLQSTKRTQDEYAVQELTAIYLERLRLDPLLQEAPKLVYLVGSTLMESENHAAIGQQLGTLLDEYPDYGFSDGLHYWLGLSAVMQGDYRSAHDHFSHIIDHYPGGGYAEDAQYRLGVCWFGLGQPAEARLQLEGFLEDYPQSRLECEAQALLGDIAASAERWNEALNAYAAAHSAGAWLDPPNMAYINHAVFSGGEILATQGRWEEVAEWYDRYLRRWGRTGRAGDALYQLGRAQIELGQTEAMLELWIESILEFGNDPADAGPDLMLAEFAQHYEAERGTTPVPVLRDALAIAAAQKQVTLQLRLAHVLHTLGEPAETLPQLDESNLPHASAAVLLAAAQDALATSAGDARHYAEASLDRDAWGEFAAPSLAVLAQAQTELGNLRDAAAAWQRLANRFPDSALATEAWLRQGDLHRQRGAPDSAIAAYREVLKVREWRGAPWAEANYKIGLTHYEAGDYSAAFGFCQRVYVLYGGVVEWAAPAYLTSGLALEKLNRATDAVATYRELLADQSLAEQPAAAEATERLRILGDLS